MRPELSGAYLRAMRNRITRRLFQPLLMTGAHELNATWALRFENARMVRMALRYVGHEDIRGAYAEFGVFRGQTFVEAWHAAGDFGLTEMPFVACDSFQGLPASEGPFVAGGFANTRADFEAMLRAHRVDPRRVEIVEGFFADSLTPGVLPQVAVAWIDCDLYESTVPVLESLTDSLADGAVVVFDDWFNHRGRPDRGEQRACTEWLDRHPNLRLAPYRDYGFAGRSFLFSRMDDE